MGWCVALVGWLALGGWAEGMWITGYYPQYEASTMAAAQIDFTTVTHAIHFAVAPKADATLDTTSFGLAPAACGAFVGAVHGAGRKALVCVGGAGSQAGFEGATTGFNAPYFVTALTSFMRTNGYDGVDIDWEPLDDSDVEAYTNFVGALRAAIGPGKLLTVAAPAYTEGAMFAGVQRNFDQINIMTYDLSGPWPGWVTWFNSPIQDGGYKFPSTGRLVPSVDGAVADFEKAGVAGERLGIGAAFYGYAWSGGAGVTQPRQGWNASNPPYMTVLTYQEIVAGYYQGAHYHWDNGGQAAYLSVTNSPASNDLFISYDDAKACQSKVSYARNHGLGGIMIWEVSQDYNGGAAAGQRSPLMLALKQALATPRILSVAASNGNLSVTFSSAPLANYRILWTSNLAAGSWSTLSNGVSGTGGAVQVTDTLTAAGARFYRVQTPP